MTGHRVLVRPAHSLFGLLVLSAAVGAVAATPVGAHSWAFLHLPGLMRGSFYLWIFNSTQVALALIPFIAFVIWLARQTQRPMRVACAAATYALALVLMTSLIVDLHMPYLALEGRWIVALMAMGGPMLGAVLAIFGMKLYQLFGSRVIEQDGMRCYRCGYPMGRSKSVACPECGETEQTTSPTRSERLIAGCAQRSWIILLLIATVWTIGYARVLTIAIDHRTLRAESDALSDGWRPYESIAFGLGRLETVIYHPIEVGDEDAALLLALARQSAFHRRSLSLRIGNVWETPAGRDFIVPGTVWIVMPVPPDRQRDVLRHGPPEAAVKRLIEAAREADWQPTDRWEDWNGVVVELEWIDD